MSATRSTTHRTLDQWFTAQEWRVQSFQREVWAHMAACRSGLLNAPTGSGKTYAVWGGVVNSALLNVTPASIRSRVNGNGATPGQARNDTRGLRAIWITPLRALAGEIAESAQRMCDGVGLDWKVGVRTGDTSTKERAAQKKALPQLLVTTPESLHVLLATKGYAELFKHLDWFIADEWHELLGSKRGVQVELGLSRLKALRPQLGIWGISATIGNLQEAMTVLHGADLVDRTRSVDPSGRQPGAGRYAPVLVRSTIKKPIEVRSIIPEKVEHYPWAGHLGLKLARHLLPIIEQSTSTLIFTNTRAQSEIWYHHLLDIAPELAGTIALHHGSLDRNVREWVEQALDVGKLKAVVCTSSLDLGVDFRPVESVVQIGGPKGVARFVQRAGRSGHRPDATSRIWFLPTHALELVEAAALRQAAEEGSIEARQPLFRCFDVLAQYLVTLAVSDGFSPAALYHEVRSTWCFKDITSTEWDWLLTFITSGGRSLAAYDEFNKAVVDDDGLVRVHDRRIALRHRLSIGTIVSDSSYAVKLLSGGRIGTVEEWFINQLKPGDVFWFAGRSLELVRVKDLVAQVRKSREQKGKIPSWQGGRMPLSSYMAKVLREQLTMDRPGPEMSAVEPILQRQRETSIVPSPDELLIERFTSREGYHVVVYPFEGRLPKAYGADLGATFKPLPRMLVNAALWGLYLESELVYVGDGGVVETSDPTRRMGVDLSVRYQLTDRLFADVDVNAVDGTLVDVPEGENAIPLAPRFTTIGGLAYVQDRGFNASLRYRHITDRPANEDNSVVAEGYFLIDAKASYRFANLELGATVENLLDVEWNQAQFDTESRLSNEVEPVSELHFTPGTPFFLKGFVTYLFPMTCTACVRSSVVSSWRIGSGR
ncbi:MAG: TonB-dependent receptor [Flavobacteriales bacterium]|nr:TonB-dependent receptor [Flavobacteriales bacterium]